MFSDRLLTQSRWTLCANLPPHKGRICAASSAGKTFPPDTAHCRRYASVTAIRNAPWPSRDVINVGEPNRIVVSSKPRALLVDKLCALSCRRFHGIVPLDVEIGEAALLALSR